MGDIPSAIAFIVAVLAILNYIWSLMRPDTGLHGALKRRFSKTKLQVVEDSAGVRDPIFSIPCGIGIPPGSEHAIQYDSRGLITILPQYVNVSPRQDLEIDIRRDLGYSGRNLNNRFSLTKCWVHFTLILRNGSSHPGSMLLLETAKIEVENYRELALSDEEIAVLVNTRYAIGGDGGVEVPTHRSNALLSSHGAIAYEDNAGEYDAKDNLLMGKRIGLKSGDIVGLQIKLYFAHSGVFQTRLRVDGVDERGRAMGATSDTLSTAIVVASAEDLASREVRFLDIMRE